MATNVIMPFL